MVVVWLSVWLVGNERSGLILMILLPVMNGTNVPLLYFLITLFIHRASVISSPRSTQNKDHPPVSSQREPEKEPKTSCFSQSGPAFPAHILVFRRVSFPLLVNLARSAERHDICQVNNTPLSEPAESAPVTGPTSQGRQRRVNVLHRDLTAAGSLTPACWTSTHLASEE